MAIASMLQKLRQEITAMGEMIENAVDTALMALVDRDPELAHEVIMSDEDVDEMENAIDQTAHAILHHQSTKPEEFRFVVACMKICVDLERVGDLAVDIARSVSFLVTRQPIMTDFSAFTTVIETSEQMVRDSVSCLIDRNTDLAWTICLADELVDNETQRLHDYLVSLGQDAPEKVERAVHMLYIVRSLERIADQATNIAEEVIFMLEGKVVRHHIGEYRRQLEADQRRKKKTAREAGTRASGSRRTARTASEPKTRKTPATKKIRKKR